MKLLPLDKLGNHEQGNNKIHFGFILPWVSANKKFIQTAHEQGIAVVLDMIFGHTRSIFAYEYVYKALDYHQNPFMGLFAKDMFAPVQTTVGNLPVIFIMP
jgi:hypothetical protein